MFISTHQEFWINLSIGDKWSKTSEKQDGVVCKQSDPEVSTSCVWLET